MVQVAVKHEYIGVATGVVIYARPVGGAVATTFYVSVLQQKLKASHSDTREGHIIEAGLEELPSLGPQRYAQRAGFDDCFRIGKVCKNVAWNNSLAKQDVN